MKVGKFEIDQAQDIKVLLVTSEVNRNIKNS